MYKLRIRNEAEPNILDMNIFSYIEHIDYDCDEFISARKLRTQIDEIKPAKITLHVNSEGGDLIEALAIYDYLQSLKNSGVSIEAVIEGICASSAVIIVMAADKISMTENSYMMIHEPTSYVNGTSDELNSYSAFLADLSEKIINIISQRSGLNHEMIKAIMQKETWLNAQMCKNFDLCDEIIKPEQKTLMPEPENETAAESKQNIRIENKIRDSRNIQVSTTFKPVDKFDVAVRNMAEIINRKRGFSNA